MKTIYIVTAGEYSDYHICAVFETEELAKQYIATFKIPHEFNIQPFEMNSVAPDIGMFAYWVRMERNGNVSSVAHRDSDYGFDEGAATSQVTKIFDGSRQLQVYCFAKDEAHAVKIAGEKRREIIANGQWE